MLKEGVVWGWRKSTYVVVHIRCAEEPNAHVVGELNLVDICAVRLDVCTIIDVIICVHESDVLNPGPDTFYVLSVGVVVCVSCKSSAYVEKAAVGDGVLVIVSSEIWVYLPSQPSGFQPIT